MKTGFVWHERYMWHDNGSAAVVVPTQGQYQPDVHLENPETKRRLKNLLDGYGITRQLLDLEPEPVSLETLSRVHSPAYIAKVRALSSGTGGSAGEFALVGPGSYEIALLSAGGALCAMRAVLDGECRNAYALCRPPGHHAEPEQGMGFCLFNNVAVAIEQVRAEGRVKRVAVIDWDVHHGNGAEAIFFDNPDVLTISVHQEGLYPLGRGGSEVTGGERAPGSNLNIPLPAGAGSGAYQYAFEQLVIQALQGFRPELIVIACGFDAAGLDPMGRMQLSSSSFRWMTEQLLAQAEQLCGGRLVAIHEGGYSASYVPFCGAAVIEALSGIQSGLVDPVGFVLDAQPGQVLNADQRQRVDAIRGEHPLFQ
ncbi:MULTISPECIES: class II histone deacetylase [Pseudomonas]|uniref:Histone deacetylase domain-containing protein n=1 Tax=Pseudomonas fluorescens LMG 5329 TaxID=1324332 RepID=A0A0A1Z305_PSEFL|nr:MULTISPECIES: class II histone deacetylase [Pseudomonas]KGE67604.1 hypothetical protein K814_0112440 [Pseudomonas fluorescens LMG 5329]NWE04814.1 class II histone deacetylase [Pseudomonas sp. IPO3749]NWF24551.1 class II histone deacetylase [Pseudomonas sp. IPO3749]